jgi:hypothetical protein
MQLDDSQLAVQSLYQAELSRWDDELEARLLSVIEGRTDLTGVIDHVVEELFDFQLAKREWVALTARATMGIELPEAAGRKGHGWLRFIDGALQRQKLGALKLDTGLLLISVEGMLDSHILARSHYQELYGKDVTDPKLKRRTKEHLKTILRAVLAAN